MNVTNKTTDAKAQWVSVPFDCLHRLRTGAMTGVFIGIDESLEWTFRYNEDGTRDVIGYTVTKRVQ